ncbi:hypothetical protein ACTOV4_23495 [Brucella sp. C7-11G]
MKITQIQPSEQTRIRLEAAKLHGKRRLTIENRLREIERETISSTIKSGAPRWEAFRKADELIAGIRDRLQELTALAEGKRATVLPMAAAGGRL